MSRTLSVAEWISYAGCVALASVGLIYGYWMMQDDTLVGLVPVASSALLLLFSLLSIRARPVASPENPPHDADAPRSTWTAPIIMAALIGYLILINVLGFMLDTGLLIVVVMLAAGVRNIATIAITLAALLGVGFMFQQLLGIELPRGVF
jgi:hypothetical protein